MADDSPGKVQALRAIFSEKNNPVMGLIPPAGKIASRPWRPLDKVHQEKTENKKITNELRTENNRVLPTQQKIQSQCFNGGMLHKVASDKQTKLVLTKPAVGPKPSYLMHQHQRTISPALSSESVSSNGSLQNGDCVKLRTIDEDFSKSKTFGETIASFMFANNKNCENVAKVTNITTAVNGQNDSLKSAAQPPPLPPVPKPRISQLQNCLQNHVDIMNFCNAQNSAAPFTKGNLDTQCRNIINSDNYICKNSRVRRRVLPSQEKLGPAPLKPTKPGHLKLPTNISSVSVSSTRPETCSSLPPPQVPPPNVPTSQRPTSLQRPTYPCPPRPVTSPPLPPVIKPTPTTLREEIEELYEDTLLGENKRPVSLIPEYTEEEEQAELYHDAADGFEESSNYSDTSSKYKQSPLPASSEYLQPNNSGSSEELYQDANGTVQEEFYEVMPCDEIPEDAGSPLYSNNKKEIEKLKKEEEKRIRKEQKEKEKREKEQEKLRKKFGLTGEEIPIDHGLVKWDNRGGKGDLPVKKGETVLILRMEGNPSGRWLVKNEKGKIGYVELTNIEVDPLSVKSVMSIRRLSVISAGEELYCEAKSEEEGIYEVTY